MRWHPTNQPKAPKSTKPDKPGKPRQKPKPKIKPIRKQPELEKTKKSEKITPPPPSGIIQPSNITELCINVAYLHQLAVLQAAVNLKYVATVLCRVN